MTESAYSAEIFIGASWHWARLKGEEKSTNVHILEPVSNDEIEISLALKSLDKYFSDSAFGYFYELGYDTYDLEGENNINPFNENITTRSIHFTPTVFYEFTKGFGVNWSLKIGLGVGLGYIDMDGQVISGSTPVVINDAVFGYSTGLLFRLEYKNLVFIAREYIPNVDINGFDLKLELPVITAGYRFYF